MGSDREPCEANGADGSSEDTSDMERDPLVELAYGESGASPPTDRRGSADPHEGGQSTTGHARDGRPIADGGMDFEQTADVTMSKGERRRQWIDEKVLAPARIVWSDWRARVGVLVVLFYVLLGTVGTRLVAPPSPNQGPLLVGAFKTLEHPFGTTYSGVDILSQTVHATPPMLVMIASGAVFTVVLGTAVGTVAGYKGGRIDQTLMTVNDMIMAIPGLPLTVVLAAVLEIEGDPAVIGILVVINAWAGLARAIRSQVLTLREAEYVEASRVMGIKTSTIVLGDIVPNLMPYISMNFVQQARAVIFGSVGLYFLGLLPYTSTNWGVMMDAAVNRAGATSSPAAFHWLFVPMMALIVLALGLTLLAQGADRIFNPRVRARHAESIEDEDGEGGGGAAAAATGGI